MACSARRGVFCCVGAGREECQVKLANSLYIVDWVAYRSGVAFDRDASRRWAERAAHLQANPRKWHVIDDVKPANVRAHASNIRRGKMAAFRPTEHWQVGVVSGVLWARYLGPRT